MPSRARSLVARLPAGVGLALAGGLGAAAAFALAPAAVAIPAVLAGTVALLAALTVRDRRAAARRQADLLAEVRAGHDRLAAQADEIARHRDRLRANEARLLGTLRAARMVAWEWDTATGGVTLSGPARDWVGSRHDFDPDDPDPLAAFVHPDDRPRLAAARRTVLDGADGFEVEYRLVRADGRPVWVLSRGQRARDDQGRPTGRVTGVLVDVTARRESEARFRLLESAVVHARDAVVVLEADPDPGSGRRVRYANDAFFRMTGYAPAEVVGRSLHLLRCPDADPAALDRVRQALDAGRPVRTELRNRKKDGTGYWVDLSLVPVPDPGGKVAHWVMIQRDVTDRKRAEDALRASEGRYRLLFDRNPHPMWVVDARSRRFLAVNDAAVHAYGYSRDEFLRLASADLRPPDESSRLLSPATLEDEEFRPPSVRRHRKKDGAVIDVEVASFALTLDGRPAELVLGIDVTERRRAEVALRRSEALFRAVFEGASAGFSLTDATGRFVALNPAFAALVGRPEAEVLGRSPAAFTHPDDWAAQTPLMAEVLAGRRDRFDALKRYVRPDGAVVWAELSFAAIRGADGRYEYGLGVSVDVTERRKLEEQLRQAQKMEAVGQMAGGLAHDFNNLLTAVIGNLALAKLPPGDPSRPLLAAAEQAAVRAADLTRKLLGYARRNQLLPGPVDPHEAFAEVVGLLRRTLDPRIAIRVEVSPGCGPVLADPGLLNQALMNLCLNSRDAMPDGGTLTLSADRVDAVPAGPGGEAIPDTPGGPFVRMSVSDTGCGMTDAVKSRIFDPFFTTKGVGKGTGLGLPMVHGIVKQHRGWVGCTSAPGRGTRIDLYLPAADALAGGGREPPDESSDQGADAPRPPAAPGDTPPDGTPTLAAAAKAGLIADPTILVVDDEPMIRDLGRAILERAGYRVVTAEDGLDAVEVFARERGRIGLVVLDVMMPRMSGRDAFRELVRLDPGVKVLFSTGYSAEELSELDGAVGLLNKPYRPAELLAAVRDALAGSPTGVGR
jgi:PAS domain S-box-containing protein